MDGVYINLNWSLNSSRVLHLRIEMPMVWVPQYALHSMDFTLWHFDHRCRQQAVCFLFCRWIVMRIGEISQTAGIFKFKAFSKPFSQFERLKARPVNTNLRTMAINYRLPSFEFNCFHLESCAVRDSPSNILNSFWDCQLKSKIFNWVLEFSPSCLKTLKLKFKFKLKTFKFFQPKRDFQLKVQRCRTPPQLMKIFSLNWPHL